MPDFSAQLGFLLHKREFRLLPGRVQAAEPSGNVVVVAFLAFAGI
jgi:hypothetical protein